MFECIPDYLIIQTAMKYFLAEGFGNQKTDKVYRCQKRTISKAEVGVFFFFKSEN